MKTFLCSGAAAIATAILLTPQLTLANSTPQSFPCTEAEATSLTEEEFAKKYPGFYANIGVWEGEFLFVGPDGKVTQRGTNVRVDSFKDGKFWVHNRAVRDGSFVSDGYFYGLPAKEAGTLKFELDRFLRDGEPLNMEGKRLDCGFDHGSSVVLQSLDPKTLERKEFGLEYLVNKDLRIRAGAFHDESGNYKGMSLIYEVRKDSEFNKPPVNPVSQELGAALQTFAANFPGYAKQFGNWAGRISFFDQNGKLIADGSNHWRDSVIGDKFQIDQVYVRDDASIFNHIRFDGIIDTPGYMEFEFDWVVKNSDVFQFPQNLKGTMVDFGDYIRMLEYDTNQDNLLIRESIMRPLDNGLKRFRVQRNIGPDGRTSGWAMALEFRMNN